MRRGQRLATRLEPRGDAGLGCLTPLAMSNAAVRTAADGVGSVRLASATGRWVLAVAVLGEVVTLLEATVVNVSLPAIGDDFGAGFAGLQWILDGYVLTLAALMLLGGSLGDRYGRRRVFELGVVVFMVASALCAAAPSVALLILGRFLQGIGGALLIPATLAIIDAVFHPDDRVRAIGAWAGLGAVAAAGTAAGRPVVLASRLPGQPPDWDPGRRRGETPCARDT